MSEKDPTNSPSPIPPTNSSGSKFDNLSKDDLVKFAKKQVANLSEMKKNQIALMDKLKTKLTELERAKSEIANLKTINAKLAVDRANKSENNPAECTECIKKSEKLVEIEKKLAELSDKATRADIFSLEIRDLEAKVDNLNRYLKEKSESLAKAHEVIQESDAKIAKIRNELSSSSTNVEKLQEENGRLKNFLQEEKKKVCELESRLNSTESRLVEISDKQGNEKLSLAKLMADSENQRRVLEEAVDALRNENIKLSTQLEDKSYRLEELEKEYTEYKNKAHFVLQQRGNQQDENKYVAGQLEKAKEELEEIRVRMEELENDRMQAIDDLSKERNNSERLNKELQSLKIRSSDFERNHTSIIDELRMSSSKTIQRLEEEIRVQRSSRDSSEKKYREILTAKEKVDHLLQNERQRSEAENSDLRNKLEIATKHLENLEREVKELHIESESRKNSSQPLSHTIPSVIPQQIQPENAIHINNLHMDSVSCYEEATQAERSLEDILYGDLDDGYELGNMELTEEKFNRLVEELENMKKSNLHVSELLSEAESANGRLVGQNTLLKEEIRRLERKEERNEELSNEQNMEYLKNVLVQFLKPESVAAERNQLIIVLQRVLHLSPMEVEVLKETAAKMTSLQNTNSSWSSYLSWTNS